MNKEEVIANICHYSKVTKDFTVKYAKVAKDFTVKQYHRFAEYLAEKCSENRKNGNFTVCGMTVTKYVFILMNMFYLFMALFMIFMGSSSYYALDAFYNMQWLDVQGLSIVWIISGVFLAFISVFGMIGALRESIAWTNIYGVLLCITFFLQIITSVAAFCLVATGSSGYHATNMIDHLIRNYYYNRELAHKMDYIQRTLQCCGREGPSDWELNRFEYENAYFDTTTRPSHTGSPTTESLTLMPTSCCAPSDDYYTTLGPDGQNDGTCKNYFKKGCATYLTDLVAETVLIVASVLLTIGVLQIVGVVCSFMLARIFRRVATYRSVQKFNSQYEKVFDVPSYVDYQRLHNSNDALDNVNQNQ